MLYKWFLQREFEYWLYATSPQPSLQTTQISLLYKIWEELLKHAQNLENF